MSISTYKQTVTDIVVQASEKSGEIIKEAVRERMSQKPYPGGFVFAMGSFFWLYRNDEVARKMPRTDDIQEACEVHLDSFGSLAWRIDRDEIGGLIERDDW